MTSSTTDKIVSQYIAFFNRAPDKAGLEYWEGVAASSGLTDLPLMKSIAAGFATHPAFQQIYGNLGNAAFVTAVYVNVGGKAPDAGGLNYWVTQLNNGLSRSDFVAEFCYYCLELTDQDLANLGLTPQELADAIARREQLSNKIEVSIAFVTAMGDASNLAPTTDPDNVASLLQDPAYQAAINIIRDVNEDPASMGEELAYLNGTPTINGINTIFGPSGPPAQGQNFILTPGLDILTGGAGNDTFFANENTLNAGDRLDGGAGTDTLKLAVGAFAGEVLVAPTLANIEVVEVNSPNSFGPAIGIDLSNADGYETLRSYQVTDFNRGPGFVAFYDIQNVNNTNLQIIDTHVDHYFSYDLNGYLTPAAGSDDDYVDLMLQEVRGSGIYFGDEELGTEGDFGNSNVDGINLESVRRFQVSNSYYNEVSELRVGDNFRTLNISGGADAMTNSADLWIQDWLDPSVARIDADGDGAGRNPLYADLRLQVSHYDSSVKPALFVYEGALDDGVGPADRHDGWGPGKEWAGYNDVFLLERDGNSVITLNSGNDALWARGVSAMPMPGTASANGIATGFGNMTISGGTGDDEILLDMNGRHEIDLGDGDDDLEINGNVDDYNTAAANDGTTDIVAGEGNDAIQVNGNGRYDVALGSGHDSFTVGAHPGPDVGTYTGSYTVDGADGNDSVTIWAVSGSIRATLGKGDDDLIAVTAGNHSVDAADGDDLVALLANGNQTVLAGAGDDAVFIGDDGIGGLPGNPHNFFAHGVHNVDLGEGDDYLLINGGRKDPAVTDEDNSGDNAMTTVIGGDGKDTVDVRFDHYLNADLGDGDDRIILRARDLTTDDNIAGGAGRDTMQLSNESYDEELVGQSETGSTTGFEKFDLRNANITLRLTSDNFDTAENRAITVYTEEADRAELPSNLVALGLAQGMTVNQFTATAQAFGPTSAPGNDALARANLAKWLLNNSAVKGVDFADANGDGDNKLYTSAGSVPGTIAVESSPGVLPGTIDRLDRVNFRVEPDGYMAVDITAVPLSLASGRTFTLEGGNIRDVVIADDDSINGRSALRFDGPASVNQSVQDTLYVVGPADIEAADLRNVSGLENIILSPDGSQPGLWEVVLTAPVVNQTTGSAPLSIIALPEVPAGSELRVTLDPTVHSSSTNDVVIKRNSNISVYIDNVLVTEPNFGVTDYNTGVYSVTVINQLLFTTNADNLIGGAGSDEFLAQTVAQINSSDSADGMGGFDTAIFRFAVANPATTLRDQFENANFVSIEEFIFDTENNVSMNGLGLGYVPDLQRLQTGSGDDSLMAMRSGLEYALGGGDDEIGILGSATTTIDGGAGSDSVFGGGSNNYFRVRDVEFIDVDGGSDQVDLLDPNPDLVTVLNVETLNGSSGSDWVYADNNGGSILVDMGFGNDTLTVGGLTPTDATVYGGGNSDSLTVYATVSAVVYGDFGPGETIFDGNDTISVFVPDGDATIYGNGGDDNIYVDVESGTVVVYAGSGDDTVDVQAFPPGGGGTVFGGTGNDSINVFAWTNASISGGDGNDTIVSTWSDFTTIDGGSGDDSIDVVTFDNGTVLGGSGNDTINASGFGDDVIDGDEGDDLISATGSGDNTITGGAGNDTISLAGNANDAENILVFGDIAYDALQQQTTNTQGQDSISGFNFEDPAPGDPAPLAQDYMDFSVFLGPGPVGNAVTYNGTYVRGVTTVTANAAAGNSLVVVSNAAASFSAADFSVSVPGTIWLNDDASAVVVVGLDETGPGSGIGTFDVYYVEDIDTGAGQTWAVNLVANVSALTLVGVEAVIDNLIVT